MSSLTSRLAIPPSSYYYARRAAAAPDRWAEARAALAEEFEAVGGSRGYRYLRMRLAARGIACGERTVRRLMREEGLEVPRLRRPRRWSSYAGVNLNLNLPRFHLHFLTPRRRRLSGSSPRTPRG